MRLTSLLRLGIRLDRYQLGYSNCNSGLQLQLYDCDIHMTVKDSMYVPYVV